MATTTRKRAQTKKKAPLKQTGGESLNNEVVIIAVCAFSILLIVSIFTESTGVVGAFLNKALFGLFGLGALILPFALFLGCIFAGFKKFRKSTVYKNTLVFVIFLCIITLVHINYYRSVNYFPNASFLDYVTYYFTNGNKLNGGLLGAMFGNIFVKTLGYLGSYIIIWAGIVICTVLVTGRSLFEGLHTAAKTAKHTAANTAKYTAEKIKSIQLDMPGVSQQPKTASKKIKRFDFLLEPEDGEITDIEVLQEEAEPDKEISIPQFEKQEAEFSATAETEVPWEENHDNQEIQAEPEQDIKIMDFMNAEPEKPKKKKEKIGVLTEIEEKASEHEIVDYDFPSIDLLKSSENNISKDTKAEMLKNARRLEETLKSFGVVARVVQINKGPAVTRYELAPNQGVKVSKIVNLADDIALSLAASGIRIEAPVPGKSVVGIEVPNKEQQPVLLREILDSGEFTGFPSKLAFGIGKDIGGSVIVWDIGKMPHLLIAGATGSGKSVCINTLITSIIYKANPNEVKLLLVDPKVVELSVYNGIPHLLIPVVTDPKKAAGALNWAVAEMLNRYKLFSEENVRDLKGYNASKIENLEFDGVLPQIVIIIDELADLMMVASKEVEDAIMRLAQMARAAGIHLIIATQRPSVDVITGVIKANIPSRLAFSVSSGTDSRTILDMVGAEKLLGKGDMLFYPIGMPKPIRVQGAFISDKEVESIVNEIKREQPVEYDKEMEEIITSAATKEQAANEDSDEFLMPAVELIVGKKKASVSMLQRQFRIGYNRAARLMEELENRGYVGPEDGSKPRKVLITQIEYEALKG